MDQLSGIIDVATIVVLALQIGAFLRWGGRIETGQTYQGHELARLDGEIKSLRAARHDASQRIMDVAGGIETLERRVDRLDSPPIPHRGG